MKQAIVGYHQDEEGYWVAELAYGHNQHVRHKPPWFMRPWTTSEAGRAGMLGQPLDCRLCDAGDSTSAAHCRSNRGSKP
ncbi:MAG TPA: DUF3565 domain-containing protein [Gammaproteobacteria bacterium]|nr:DUF3565 domain-containing protein [Gammaproteobacteria bacterium]